MSRPALFNHPYYLELRRPIAAEHVVEAVRRLAAHHDSLRLRFRRDEDGMLWQHHAECADAVPFASHDLSGMSADEQDAMMESLATREQLALDLTDGPTCRVVHFGTGPRRRDRLLVVAHHLVVDAISRGTLLGDLQSLCAQLDRGEEPRLPAKTTAYSTWAQRLSEVDFRDQLAFWLDQAAGENTMLPPDNPDAVTTMGAWGTLDTTLTVAETSGLHDVTRQLRVNVRDLIVWAMADTVAARTGGGCAIATTGHGREDLFDDVDLNRTTGWFQVMYPVLLRLPAGATPAGSITALAGQLDRVPHNGIGHGLLKFACQDREVRRRLAANPEPRMAINYMGNFGFDEVSQAEELFDVCHAPFGPTEDETGRWPYDLDVTGTIVAGQLRIDVGYGTDVYHHDTAAAFLSEVRTRLLTLLD
jgi:non-ribosomal peptide synthase protein (TIGR01720 family)